MHRALRGLALGASLLALLATSAAAVSAADPHPRGPRLRQQQQRGPQHHRRLRPPPDGTLTPLPGSPFTTGGAGTGSVIGSAGAIQFSDDGRYVFAVDAAATTSPRSPSTGTAPSSWSTRPRRTARSRSASRSTAASSTSPMPAPAGAAIAGSASSPATCGTSRVRRRAPRRRHAGPDPPQRRRQRADRDAGRAERRAVVHRQLPRRPVRPADRRRRARPSRPSGSARSGVRSGRRTPGSSSSPTRTMARSPGASPPTASPGTRPSSRSATPRSPTAGPPRAGSRSPMTGGTCSRSTPRDTPSPSYRIAHDGSLTLLGSTPLQSPSGLRPFDARLDPAGRYLYIVDAGARAISVLRRPRWRADGAALVTRARAGWRRPVRDHRRLTFRAGRRPTRTPRRRSSGSPSFRCDPGRRVARSNARKGAFARSTAAEGGETVTTRPVRRRQDVTVSVPGPRRHPAPVGLGSPRHRSSWEPRLNS